MPVRPCLTCGRLGAGSYCARHDPDRRRKRITPGRGNGTDAARFRAETLARTGGRCAICGSTEGVEAHHVVGLREGGPNDGKTNGEPLCKRHHVEVERARAQRPPERRRPDQPGPRLAR